MLLNHHLDSLVKQSEAWTREKDMFQTKINLKKNLENPEYLRIQLRAEFILKKLHLQLMLAIVTLMMTRFNILKTLLQVQVLMKFTQPMRSRQRNSTLIVKSHHLESQQKDLLIKLHKQSISAQVNIIKRFNRESLDQRQ